MSNARLSRAAVALRKKLHKRGAQRALTKAIECAEGMVSRWLSGDRQPSIAQAVFIERIYGIPVAWWTEPAPLEKADKAA